MSTDTIEVKAKFEFLPLGESKRSNPIFPNYRPNHNFGDEHDFEMYIGQIEFNQVPYIKPGNSELVRVRFLDAPGLKDLLTVGRRWRIQEGPHLIGYATLCELSNAPLPSVQAVFQAPIP